MVTCGLEVTVFSRFAPDVPSQNMQQTDQAVFVDELGADSSCLSNATPKDDFGGGHADPNLTYAKDLVKAMGLTSKGAPLAEAEGKKVKMR